MKTTTHLLILMMAFTKLGIAHAEDAKKPDQAIAPSTAATPEAAVPPAVDKKAIPEDEDVSNLADQYWRPGEDELGVIQDRRYDKVHRVEATLLYGFYQGGGYSVTHASGAAIAYHWSNAWATEVSALRLTNTNSDFLVAVQNQYGFTPDFNRESAQYSASMVWTPIYAKFALLGKQVSHFETYFAPGIGLTQTTSSRLTGIFSVGEKFFLSEHCIFRIEWKMSRYNDDITATQGSYATKNGGPGYYKQTAKDNNLMFGLGWLF